MTGLDVSPDGQFDRLGDALASAASDMERLDTFMARLMVERPGLSKLLAISQASGFLRGTPLTVRDLGDAYDRAKARTGAAS